MARMKPQALLLQSKKKKVPSRLSVKTIIFYLVFVAFIIFILCSTYNRWISSKSYGSETDSHVSDSKVDGSSLQLIDSKPPKYAVLTTSKGAISVELFKDSSTNSLKMFIELSQSGYFNGKHFDHVVKHAAIIAGNTDTSSVAKNFIMSGKHHGQVDSVRNDVFMVGTSRDLKQGQEFELVITTSSNPELKENLHIFGQVVKGQDIVQKIEDLETDDQFKPIDHVEIKNVSLKDPI